MDLRDRSHACRQTLTLLLVLATVITLASGSPGQTSSLLDPARFHQSCRLKATPHSDDSTPSPTISIAAMGDVSFARDVQRTTPMPLARISKHLDEADVVLANLESALSNSAQDNTAAQKRISLLAPVETATALRAAGVDVVSLANNHVLDAGQEALMSSMDSLAKAGVAFTGVLEESPQQSGAVVERAGIRVAVLGYCSVGDCRKAAALKWAARPAEFNSVDAVLADVQRMRQRRHADVVVVYMHWGYEYYPLVPREHERIAHGLLRGGVDILLGSHPHVPRDHSIIEGNIALYSMGNFVFDSHVCRSPETLDVDESVSPSCLSLHPNLRTYAASATYSTRLYRFEASKRGLVRAQYLPLAIKDNPSSLEEPFQPHPQSSGGTFVDMCGSSDAFCLECAL